MYFLISFLQLYIYQIDLFLIEKKIQARRVRFFNENSTRRLFQRKIDVSAFPAENRCVGFFSGKSTSRLFPLGRRYTLGHPVSPQKALTGRCLAVTKGNLWWPALNKQASAIYPLCGTPIALSMVTLDGREYVSRVIQPIKWIFPKSPNYPPKGREWRVQQRGDGESRDSSWSGSSNFVSAVTTPLPLPTRAYQTHPRELWTCIMWIMWQRGRYRIFKPYLSQRLSRSRLRRRMNGMVMPRDPVFFRTPTNGHKQVISASDSPIGDPPKRKDRGSRGPLRPSRLRRSQKSLNYLRQPRLWKSTKSSRLEVPSPTPGKAHYRNEPPWLSKHEPQARLRKAHRALTIEREESRSCIGWPTLIGKPPRSVRCVRCVMESDRLSPRYWWHPSTKGAKFFKYATDFIISGQYLLCILASLNKHLPMSIVVLLYLSATLFNSCTYGGHGNNCMPFCLIKS